MDFWTPERCKTISTQLLLANLEDFLNLALRTSNTKCRARNLEMATMINAELSTRA